MQDLVLDGKRKAIKRKRVQLEETKKNQGERERERFLYIQYMYVRTYMHACIPTLHYITIHYNINGHFRNLKWRYLPYIRPM